MSDQLSHRTPHAPATLLIADDDPVARSMLSMGLERRFELVAVVEDAAQAVASATDKQPDAALVDVQMPGGGGIAAVRGIARACPNTAVVVLSSDEEEDSVRALMNAGAVCYVRKGIDLHELSTTLDRAISAHRHAAR